MAEEQKAPQLGEVVTETGAPPLESTRAPAIEETTSPLGIDPADTTPSVFETPPETVVSNLVPAVEPKPEVIPATPAEPAAPVVEAPAAPIVDPYMQEKAAAYDYINSDPKLSGIVNDYVNKQLGRVPEPQTMASPQQETTDVPVTRAEFDNLSRMLQQVVIRSSKGEIETFRKANPGFTQRETMVGQLVKNHGLSLEQADLLAQAQNGGVSAVVVPPSTVAPAEGSVSGGERTPSAGVDPMVEARERMDQVPANDRKRLEKVMRIAFDGAVKTHT